MTDSEDRQEARDASPTSEGEFPAENPGGSADGLPPADYSAQPAFVAPDGGAAEDPNGLTGEIAALTAPDSGADVPEAAPVVVPVAVAEPVAEAAPLPEPADAEVTTEPEPADAPASQDAAEATGEPAEPEAAPEAEETPAETAESLDDIAPGTVAGATDEASAEVALPVEGTTAVPVWPFMVYFVLWLVFAALLAWQGIQTPQGTPIYELEMYSWSIMVGLVLTALGPLLALVVWLTLWIQRPAHRAGLFSRALILGAMTTLAGVLMWWVALVAVDAIRLGRLM